MDLFRLSLETSSAISAIVSFLTLLVVIVYAYLTNKISKAATRQSEDLETPFLALINNNEGITNQQGELALKNLGKGPAINISYTGYRQDQPHTVESKPLGPGDMRTLGSFRKQDLHDRKGFKVTYESLSGRKFETEIKYDVDGREYHLRFVRLNTSHTKSRFL